MATTSYNKPPLHYQQQLALLKTRGLVISSGRKALHLLENLSYYRLSGYWYPLLAEPKTNHVFKPGARFDSALSMYRFDQELRAFILRELEKIEIAVRAKLVFCYSHAYGPFWFAERSLFTHPATHIHLLTKLRTDYHKSDEEFIQAFKLKYANPLPPAWMMVEITSFGTISKMYQHLRPGKTKRDIAHFFGLDDSTFESWLHCLVYVRNICAHHSRLWNRGISIRPQKPRSPGRTWLQNHPAGNNKIYYILSMILYLLGSVDPVHECVDRFQRLLRKYPNIDVMAMGFPPGWRDEPLWRPLLKRKT